LLRSSPPHGELKPKILVADADAATRALYSEVLGLAGWEVLQASDGREALTVALVRVPNVVLTDLRLSIIDGQSLYQILRCDRTTAAVPIVTVTGESRSSELDRARRSGADMVLTKPIAPEVLLEKINGLLERPIHDTQGQSADVPSSVQADGAIAPPHKRQSSSKAYLRYSTTSPPKSPPALTCPSCDAPLVYVESHVGGVNDRHAEQWDDFECATCGGFQYRQRTRKLRRAR
jgi:two-component system, cell cycle response regulator DivK